ncbi:hypothetical protein K488DRAFT_89517 [Vararia minispora EC-137]|uniref:Uncharacterized protein n=1 Tax=Vararia minispora EC-137 TaxID=1314806 RepID=A0ACB8QA89_9AGAM|nr:hypothetical protein K488DRAFT_89517 [Vararia minispora EC-137]
MLGDFWFEDGTIILRTNSLAAPSGPKTKLYRVHKSVLAANSTFFAQLFSGETNFDRASERYDDLPVMDVFDADEEVVAFLTALYLPAIFSAVPGQAAQPSFLLPYMSKLQMDALRLAMKYDAGPVHARITQFFRKTWPLTLAEWDNNGHRDWNAELHGVRKVFPAQTIRCASDSDIPDILPPAYYAFSVIRRLRHSTRVRTDVLVLNDPERAILRPDEVARVDEGTKAIVRRMSVLAKPTFFVDDIIQARPRTISCSRRRHAASPSSDLWPSPIMWPCLDLLPAEWNGRLASLPRRHDPLAYMLRAAKMYEMQAVSPLSLEPSALCAPCAAALAVWIRTQRAALWEALPSIFGLPAGVKSAVGTGE